MVFERRGGAERRRRGRGEKAAARGIQHRDRCGSGASCGTHLARGPDGMGLHRDERAPVSDCVEARPSRVGASRSVIERSIIGCMRKFGQAVAIGLAAGFACAAYIYLTLPDVRPLRTVNPPTTAFMDLRAREAERRGDPIMKDQRWVPYARISPNLKRAVLVAEDSAFWKHEGIDFDQLRA